MVITKNIATAHLLRNLPTVEQEYGALYLNPYALERQRIGTRSLPLAQQNSHIKCVEEKFNVMRSGTTWPFSVDDHSAECCTTSNCPLSHHCRLDGALLLHCHWRLIIL